MARTPIYRMTLDEVTDEIERIKQMEEDHENGDLIIVPYKRLANLYARKAIIYQKMISELEEELDSL